MKSKKKKRIYTTIRVEKDIAKSIKKKYPSKSFNSIFKSDYCKIGGK